MSKQPTDWRIVYHGVEHEQYFQGAGLAFSDFTDIATGIGDSPAEALEDALEQLAMNDWDVEPIEAQQRADGVWPGDKSMVTEDAVDLHVYVSVKVK